MGDLRDQLKKAKLLSKKDAKRLAHEERVHRKKVGREGLEREQAERRDEIDKVRADDRARTREAQEQIDREKKRAAETAACQDILRNDVTRPRGGAGSQRWYFETGDGHLPWLEIDEALGFQLQSGQFWIVRTGAPNSHTYGLLEADLGRRIARALPDAVAWAPGGAQVIADAQRD